MKERQAVIALLPGLRLISLLPAAPEPSLQPELKEHSAEVEVVVGELVAERG